MAAVSATYKEAFTLPLATAYSQIRLLEAQGLVCFTHENSSMAGRPRRYFAATALGRASFAAYRERAAGLLTG